MDRVSDRSRRRSSHSSRSRRSRSQSDTSSSASSSDGETPSRSPSPGVLLPRKRRPSSRDRRDSSSVSKRRGRSSSDNDSGIDSGDDGAKAKQSKSTRSSVAGGKEEKYKKVNGKWFSRDEYTVLVKAGLLDGGRGELLSSPTTALAKPEGSANGDGAGLVLDMSDEEEDQLELEEEADELVRNLRAPMKAFETHAAASLKSTIDKAGVKFENALRSLDGQAILDHLNAWKETGIQRRRAAVTGWQDAAGIVNTHRHKKQTCIDSLKASQAKHQLAGGVAQEQWTEALTRHEKELSDIKKDMQKIKAKLATKMEIATDQTKIQHEVDRRMQEVLQGGR